MSLLNENVVTAAKVETTYGVDAVPTGADAIVTSRVKLTPLDMKTVSRELDKPESGSDQEITVDHYAMIEFDVELVGSGTLGTAPGYGKLLRACRCLETVTASTSVVYTPYRASTTSLSFRFWLDGNLHSLLGARGTFTIQTNSQGLPYLKFRFTGLYVTPTANANPTVLTGWNDFQIPEAVNYDNTPVPTLHGYSGVFKAFTMDMGAEVKVFNNPGEREVRITAHMSKGSITMLAPAIGTKDYFTTAKNSVMGTMKVEHGTTAATRWFFECAGNTCQILNPKYGDDEGRATIEADLNFVPTSAGGDEWELRFAAA
jgi:hypothetical protein